jgi:hypothetical protein
MNQEASHLDRSLMHHDQSHKFKANRVLKFLVPRQVGRSLFVDVFSWLLYQLPIPDTRQWQRKSALEV